MKITLWADLVDWPLEVSVDKDILSINGESFDFSVIPDGFSLPGSSVGSKYFVESDHIFRKDGEIYVTIRYPVTWNSPEELRNPENPIVLSVVKGKVLIPDSTPVVVEPVIPNTNEDPKDGLESIETDSNTGNDPEGE